MKFLKKTTQNRFVQAMAVDPDVLDLRIKDTSLTFANDVVQLAATAEVYHPGLSVVVDTSRFFQTVDSFDRVEEANAEIYSRMQSRFSSVKAWHQPRGILDEKSLADAALVLSCWQFAPTGAGMWRLTHPVSGEFNGIRLQAGKMGQPTLLGRVTAIAQLVLLPPLWAWASSPSSEQIEVRCISVNGADHYAIYDDLSNGHFTHLGDVSGASPSMISVLPGTYNVCMAAVEASGRIGILSMRTTVEVT